MGLAKDSTMPDAARAGIAATVVARASFLGLPLELRRRIYDFASQRDESACQQLRLYYEKLDRKKQIDAGWTGPAQPSDGMTPTRTFRVPDALIDEVDGPGVGQEIGTIEEEEDDSEDSEDDEDDDEGDDDGVGYDDDDSEAEDEEEDEETFANIVAAESANMAAVVDFENLPDIVYGGSDSDEGSNEDMETDGDQQQGEAEEVIDEDVQMSSDHESQTSSTNVQATTTPTVQHTTPSQTMMFPVTRPQVSRQWAYTVPLIQLSASPPPPNLIATSPQIRAETLGYYYKTTTLTLNLTRSLEHTSFFEDSILPPLRDAPFSPLQHLRRVRIYIVWDTLWPSANAARISRPIWDFALLQRLRAAVDTIARMPELASVQVKHYDSVDNTESRLFRWEIMEVLRDLEARQPAAQVELQSHFLTDAETVKSDSIIGRQRSQFRFIVQCGQYFR